jgi:hypothetical protein
MGTDYPPGRNLRVLEPGNGELITTVTMFMETRRQQAKAKIACFYEQKPTNVGAIIGGKEIIVRTPTSNSACLTLAGLRGG